VSKRSLLILIIVLVVASLASFVILRFVPDIVTQKLSVPPPLTKAQSVLLERSKVGLDYMSTMMEESLNGDLNHSFSELKENLAKDLDEKGLAIFLFRDGELFFWSENIDISSVKEESVKLIFVQNTWCISYWLSGENLKGLLLVKVKYDYSYQNQFLKNKYHLSLSFLNDYKISPIALKGAFPLTLLGNNAVFYLSHIPRYFEDECDSLSATITWLGFGFLIFAVYAFFWFPFFRKHGVFSSILLILSLGSIRLATLHWQLLPQASWPIFSPEVFAYSWIYPSLGDFLINSLLVFASVCYLYRNFSFGFFKHSRLSSVLSVLILGLINFSLIFFTDHLFSTLILNSTIVLEAYQIFNLNIFSGVGYLSMSFWFASVILIVHGSINQLIRCKRKYLIILQSLSFLTVLGIFYILGISPSYYALALSVVLILVMLHFVKRGKGLGSGFIISLVSIFSLYTVLLVFDIAAEKDLNIRKVIALNLSNERDPIAEVQFPSIAKRLHADSQIKQYLEDISDNEQNLYNYLYENYMGGYFKKYDFQVTVCLSTSDLFIEKTGETTRCYDFFEEMLNEYGFRIPGSSFYHLSNQNGRISYLGIIEYVLSDGSEICIYLELDTKVSRELLGYPELLLEGKLTGRSKIDAFSTAKYNNGQLLARTGSFNYPLVNQFPTDSVSKFSYIKENGFNHLIYNSEGNVVIVLSKPNVSLFNITASFAWVFLFFYITLLAFAKLGSMPINLSTTIPSFKNRIQRTMVQVLFLSLILVGIVTITYNVKSFQRKNHESLLEKLTSAKLEIENNLINENLLYPEYKDYITYYLIHLSNVFYSDINLYDSYGKLLASSRPEIFERKLLGRMMNPLAWNEMAINHQARLVHTERVGDMSYLSAYVPLLNSRNETIAYLNLPYFTRQSEFIREVFTVVVALVNLYALLILITIFLAILISNQISRPLELIREKIRKIDITKHNEPISYEGEDEVGRLVKEYNRMIMELAESAEKLAHSQRQSAWREMAKQIAHEIKNPLTPMKLSLQHLVKAKNEGQPNWEQLFDKFAATLIDQINTLSNIATEFSNFAKMPTGNIEDVDLRKILNDAVNLFSSYPNIELTQEPDSLGEIFVRADKEQLSRVFVNLLKNSVQAMSRSQQGKINIVIHGSSDQITVIVEDNGSGIPEEVQSKLFSPNFTTKSGGMGLGLSISKGIVVTLGGNIWFDTVPQQGTKFFVQLPRI